MPPWASLLRPALHRARRKYVQLATVAADGGPRVRTIVLRQFHADPPRLVFFTDRRSEKMTAMTRDPRAEVCWWSDKTREQFRLRGRLREDPAVARTLWAEARPEARATFLGPAPGGALDAEAPTATPHPDTLPGTVPETFVGLVLDVEAVDYLHLGDVHTRRRFLRTDDGWTDEAIVP